MKPDANNRNTRQQTNKQANKTANEQNRYNANLRIFLLKLTKKFLKKRKQKKRRAVVIIPDPKLFLADGAPVHLLVLNLIYLDDMKHVKHLLHSYY